MAAGRMRCLRFTTCCYVVPKQNFVHKMCLRLPFHQKLQTLRLSNYVWCWNKCRYRVSAASRFAVAHIFGLVPLISNPLRFQELEANWRIAGFECEALNLKIIKDDRDFDNWMRTIFGDGFHPVIDPMFDKNQKLVSGLMIQHQEAMIAEAAKQKSNTQK